MLYWLGAGEEKLEEGVFGPVAVVAACGEGFCEEGAVSAVCGFEQSDVGVGGDFPPGLWGEDDEGVVERVEDEGGDGDAVEDTSGSGSVVVVVCAGEAGVEGGDAVVELAEGADAGGSIGVIGSGKESSFATKASEEGAKELEFVESIFGFVESIRRRAEIDGGRDSDDGAELGGCVGAEFACEFKDEIATHGVADEGDGLQPVEVEEVVDDGADVIGESGVIEGGSELLGASAVAHVHADDVASGVP